MSLEIADVTKLLLSLLIGGLIGAEREYNDKAAGFRTLTFICAGAAMFTIFSVKLGGEDNNSARIAAQIVSGIGFIGAGVIMREGERVTGITTAAMIWLVAALGMGVGSGSYLFSLFATGIILAVQIIFPSLERWIDRQRDTRAYELVCPLMPGLYQELDTLFKDSGLHVRSRKRFKADGNMICTWYTHGSPKAHMHLVEKLFEHPQVTRFKT
ncbi:MAG: MgtC/SapB family protein [Chloroflexi bacterium]|nr:MgtC/SapB family protein [Chloroflexota bacterium]